MNFCKQFSKDIMYSILKKYYKDCDITYPQSSDSNSCDAILSSVLNEETHSELFVMFLNYECKFLYDSSFDVDTEIFDNIRVEYLIEMVKFFKDNEKYMQGLTNFYNQKLEYGNQLLITYADRKDILEIAKNEIKQAKQELELLTSVGKKKNHDLEK